MNILFSLSKRLQLPPRIDFLNQIPHDPGLIIVEEPVVTETIEEPAILPVEPAVEVAEIVTETPVVEEPVAEVIVSTPEPADEEPAWKPAWRKADLLALAIEHGLDVTEENTKAEIVEALTQAGV